MDRLEPQQEALVTRYIEGVTELTRTAVAAVRTAVDAAKPITADPDGQPPAEARVAVAERTFAEAIWPVRLLAIAMEEATRQLGAVRTAQAQAEKAAQITEEA